MVDYVEECNKFRLRRAFDEGQDYCLHFQIYSTNNALVFVKYFKTIYFCSQNFIQLKMLVAASLADVERHLTALSANRNSEINDYRRYIIRLRS